MLRYIAYPTLLVVLLTLLGCGPDVVYEDQHQITDGQWAMRDSATFQLRVPDSEAKYDLVLSIVHGETFAYENIYLQITDLPSDGPARPQVLSLNLADKYGVWTGDCSNHRCATDFHLGQRLGKQYTPTISVKQHSRQNPLSEIYGVGIRLIAVED